MKGATRIVSRVEDAIIRRVSRPGWAGALVAVSGLCSLVYQVLWERTLRYNVGGDSVSAAIVTGTFLLGLGLGAVVFGRRYRRPFLVYGAVEAGIGVFGLASFHLLAPLARGLATLFPAPVTAAEGVRPLVVAASIFFLLPPCVLIGGTGPLMFNCFVRAPAYRAAAVGHVYGLNTAGAAGGVLAAPFLLLNRLSLPAALALVGAVNLLLACAIWRYGATAASPEPDGDRADPVPPPDLRWGGLLGLAFLSGLISLAFEVVLVRALFVQNPSSPYNFPAALIPFLLSLALGSLLFSRLRHEETRHLLRRVGLLFATAVAAMLIVVVVSARLVRAGYRPAAIPPPWGDWVFLLHATLLGVALPLFLGGVLPLLLRLAAPSGHALPARTGRLFLVNSLGAFTGALLTQFAAFPTIGMRGVVIAVVLAGLGAGGACLWHAAERPRSRRIVALALLAVVALTPGLVPPALWRAFTAGVTSESADVVEGVTGVAVIEWTGASGEVVVNGQYMSRLPDHPRHVRLVSFALALPQRTDVLLLGLGGGGMVRELAQDMAVRRLDVVDWSHELARLLAGPRARRLLADALQSPPVTLRRSDARVAVALYEPASFDVVIDNLTVAHWVGATAVKSVQYFGQVHRILKPGGVLVYQGNWGGARRAILAALTETFAHVIVHPGAGLEEEVVLASDQPPRLDAAHVAAVVGRLATTTGLIAPHSWLPGLTRVTRRDLGGARPVRDDLLTYEYHRDPARALRRWLRARAR